MELFEDVEGLSPEQLLEYALERAEMIVAHTGPDDDWDDPEELFVDMAELAHAVYRLNRDNLIKLAKPKKQPGLTAAKA